MCVHKLSSFITDESSSQARQQTGSFNQNDSIVGENINLEEYIRGHLSKPEFLQRVRFWAWIF